MRKSVTKKAPKKCIAPNNGWLIPEDRTEMTRTIHFQNYLSAFMFLTRTSVYAEVQKQYPSLTLRETSVKIKIGSSKGTALTKADMTMATWIDQIALSTAERNSASTNY